MSLYEPPFRKSPLGKDNFNIPEKDSFETNREENSEEGTFKREAKRAFGELSRLWRPPSKKGEKKTLKEKPKAIPQEKKEPEKDLGIFKKLKVKKFGAEKYYSRTRLLSRLRDPYFRRDLFNKAKLGNLDSKLKKETMEKFHQKWNELAKKKNIYTKPKVLMLGRMVRMTQHITGGSKCDAL